ncbi:DUF6875 domain-containing protein [Streptomyces turgidiscabies]|uniref:DUF6875 domain-containing protein n=1 Tax=Streptomyces TaxID=1883 RepID=UPI002FF046A4
MLLTTPTIAQRAMINTWFDTYITRAHPLLGRDGAVCPYVTAARHQGVVHVRSAPVHPASDSLPRDRLLTTTAAARTWLQSVLGSALNEFEHHPWPPRARQLHSLVVVLEDLAPEHWGELDRAHEEMKTDVMRRGLMAGQFHPNCPAPAAHNPSFAVNRAPTPLIVIRRMARHDYLFAEDPQHIRAYERHFRSTDRSSQPSRPPPTGHPAHP